MAFHLKYYQLMKKKIEWMLASWSETALEAIMKTIFSWIELTQAGYYFSKEEEIIVCLSFDQGMMIISIVFECEDVDVVSLLNCVRSSCKDG